MFLYVKSSVSFSDVINCVNTKSSETEASLLLYINGTSFAAAIFEFSLVVITVLYLATCSFSVLLTIYPVWINDKCAILTFYSSLI